MSRISNIIFYNGDYHDQYTDYLVSSDKFYYLINIGNKLIDFPLPNNIQVSDINAIFSKKEIQNISNDILEYTCNWYKFDLPNTKIQNFDLFGQYLEYELKIVYSKMIKYISILNKICPVEVVIFNDYSVVSKTIINYSKNKNFVLNILIENSLSDKYSQIIYEWPLIYKSSKINLKTIFKEVFYFLKRIVLFKSKEIIFIETHKFTCPLIDYGVKNKISTICTNSTSYKELFNMNHLFFSARNFSFSFSFNSKADFFLKSLLNQSLVSDCSYYLNINLFEIVFDCFYQNLFESFKFFKLNFNYVGNFFRSNNIKHAILMQDSVGINKIIQMNSKFNYTTYMYLHGVPGIIDFYSLLKIQTDFILTFGELTKQYFNSFYSNVLSIGNAYFSKLFLSKFDNCYDFMSSNVILIIVEPISNFYIDEEPYIQNTVLLDYCMLASQNPEFTFIFRFHPSTKYYESLRVKLDIINSFKLSNIIIDESYELYKLLNSVDIVIANCSTVAFEALLLGRLFICFDPFNQDPAKYIINKAGYGVFTKLELIETVRMAYIDSNFRNMVLLNSINYINNSLKNVQNRFIERDFFDQVIFKN